MFSFIDENIQKILHEKNKSFVIDIDGNSFALDERANGDVLNMVGPIPLQTHMGGRDSTWNWYAFVKKSELSTVEEITKRVRNNRVKFLWMLLNSTITINSLLVYGDRERLSNPLIRIHSSCVTGDIFHSKRCECGAQLKEAARRIIDDGSGAIIYLANQEGRGIGLYAKAITYILQDLGHDTYEANEKLGLPRDCRDFTEAVFVINYLLGKNRPFRLLTNNPLKVAQLKKANLNISGVEKLVSGINKTNFRYMKAKKAFGHTITDQDISKATSD